MKATKSTSQFTRFAKWTSHITGTPTRVRVCTRHHRGLGSHRTALRLQRYMAARRQHRNHDRDFSHGVPDSEHAEPRLAGDPARTSRCSIWKSSKTKSWSIYVESTRHSPSAPAATSVAAGAIRARRISLCRRRKRSDWWSVTLEPLHFG